MGENLRFQSKVNLQTVNFDTNGGVTPMCLIGTKCIICIRADFYDGWGVLPYER